MSKKLFKLLLLFGLVIIPVNFAKADSLSSQLRGRILLQVQAHGEAWYVNPANSERYYLADGSSALAILHNLGIGINNANLIKLQHDRSLAKKQSGKIFLQVEDKGQAYYVDLNGILHYLNGGQAAYDLLKNFGLGISNNDLSRISVSPQSNPVVPLAITSDAFFTIPTSSEQSFESEYSSKDITLYITLADGNNRAYYAINKLKNYFLYLGRGLTGWQNYFYYIYHQVIITNKSPDTYSFVTLNRDNNLTAFDDDRDGLPNFAEYLFGTNTNESDSDSDSYSDMSELMAGYDPNKVSTAFSLYKEPGVSTADKHLLSLQYPYELDGKTEQVISDVSEIQTALEMYFNNHNYYPANLSDLSNYKKVIPVSPTMDVAACPGYRGYQYNVTGNLKQENNYRLSYCLDLPLLRAGVGGIAAGIHTATSYGLTAGDIQ